MFALPMKPLLVNNAITLSTLGTICNALMLSNLIHLFSNCVILVLHPVENGACIQFYTNAAMHTIKWFILYLCKTINPSLMIPCSFSCLLWRLCHAFLFVSPFIIDVCHLLWKYNTFYVCKIYCWKYYVT